MLENAWYSVISPEGCASILWRGRASEHRGLQPASTAQDALTRRGGGNPSGGRAGKAPPFTRRSPRSSKRGCMSCQPRRALGATAHFDRETGGPANGTYSASPRGHAMARSPRLETTCRAGKTCSRASAASDDLRWPQLGHRVRSGPWRTGLRPLDYMDKLKRAARRPHAQVRRPTAVRAVTGNGAAGHRGPGRAGVYAGQHRDLAPL